MRRNWLLIICDLCCRAVRCIKLGLVIALPMSGRYIALHAIAFAHH